MMIIMMMIRGALPNQIRSFFNLVQKAVDPSPPRFEHYVANFFDGFLKKRVNVCRDKIMRKSVETMSNLP